MHFISKQLKLVSCSKGRIVFVVKSSTECVGEELDVLYNRSPTQTFQSGFATSRHHSTLYFSLGDCSFKQTPFTNICPFVYKKISNAVALTELEISQNQDTHWFHWALSVYQHPFSPTFVPTCKPGNTFCNHFLHKNYTRLSALETNIVSSFNHPDIELTSVTASLTQPQISCGIICS